MAEKESEDPKRKPRPLVRIGVFIISHSAFVSVVCFAVGILALIFFPVLAKNTLRFRKCPHANGFDGLDNPKMTYILCVLCSANPMFSGHETMEAKPLVKDIMSIKQKSKMQGHFPFHFSMYKLWFDGM
ncbi:hypothetical protein GIB67_029283 [Kingdonia uniflora]|uniref:Uncharacterized protein n=1 Tax=Kingdonia uniflora TaxID=39325 RepID=A0A7J7N8S0_9MAGN|nr:hypothetical protein GIB67_029283 [Kingdonia uniflora]